LFAHSLHKRSSHNSQIMVTYKVLLDTRRAKSDGTYSVIIRITFNRKSSTINTGVFIHRESWNESKNNVVSTHPNQGILNKKITEEYLRIQKAVIDLESEQEFSFEGLTEILKGLPTKPKIAKSHDFNLFSRQLIADMFSMNQAGNAVIYRTATNRIMTYASRPTLMFTEITYSFLDGFKRQLIKDGVKQNSISNYFRTIRAIYNKAIKTKLVDRSHYPFLDISIKTERTAKRALRKFDLIKVSSAELKPNTPIWKARNYFFLSFALMGASFTDLAYLKPENIRKGRLIYRRKKTGQELDIKLQPYTLKLLRSFIEPQTGYLLPILPIGSVAGSTDAKRVIGQWIKTTNKYLDRLATLCKIDALITTYVTRHSWATTAKRLGYSNEMIAEGMGHEHGNKITNIYLDDFDQCVIDEMNDKVIISIIPCLKMVKTPYKFTMRPSIDFGKYKLHKTSLSIYLQHNLKV
jgi:integrase/recombinase XerD